MRYLVSVTCVRPEGGGVRAPQALSGFLQNHPVARPCRPEASPGATSTRPHCDALPQPPPPPSAAQRANRAHGGQRRTHGALRGSTSARSAARRSPPAAGSSPPPAAAGSCFCASPSRVWGHTKTKPDTTNDATRAVTRPRPCGPGTTSAWTGTCGPRPSPPRQETACKMLVPGLPSSLFLLSHCLRRLLRSGRSRRPTAPGALHTTLCIGAQIRFPPPRPAQFKSREDRGAPRPASTPPPAGAGAVPAPEAELPAGDRPAAAPAAGRRPAEARGEAEAEGPVEEAEELPAEGSQEAAAARPTAEAAGEEAPEPTEAAAERPTTEAAEAEAEVEAGAEAEAAPRAEALLPGTSKPAPATRAERRQGGPARDALDEIRCEERNTGGACPAYYWGRCRIDSEHRALTSVGKVRPGRIGTALAQHTNGAVLSAGGVFFRRGSEGSGRGLPSILRAPF